MHSALLLVSGTLMTGAALAGGPRLPPDAARLAARLDACLHFAGELNGDRSDRDRDVIRRMGELRCADAAHEATAMRRRYPRNPAVQRAMDAAAEL